VEQRILGRTGLAVSALGIGTWQLSGPLRLDGQADGFPDPGADAAVDLLRACGEQGLNLVDTAPLYGDGEGERRVGRAIRGDRDRWVICTKFGMARTAAGERCLDTAPAAIAASVEGSLRRLGTDRIELLLYHTPPARAELEAAADALARLKEAGKIRHIGVSTSDPELLELLTCAGLVEVVLLPRSLHTHPGRMLELARERELGVLVRGAFECGLLLAAPRDYPPDDIRARRLAGRDPAPYAAYRSLRPPGLSPAAFALRYLLDDPLTHSVVLGLSHPRQLDEAVEAVETAPLARGNHARVSRLRRRLAGAGLLRRSLRRARRFLPERRAAASRT